MSHGVRSIGAPVCECHRLEREVTVGHFNQPRYFVWEELLFSHEVVSNSLQPYDCSTSGSSVLHHLQEFAQLMSIESVMPSNHLILCCPHLFLPSVFPSIRVFSNESAVHIRWPQYWSFSFSIHPSNEYSGLVSFRFDWFGLLPAQGTLKSLLHNLKASILQLSAFSRVHFSHLYMTTGKIIALTDKRKPKCSHLWPPQRKL